MKYCPYCGSVNNNINGNFCENCGGVLKDYKVQSNNNSNNQIKEEGSFGWGVLGFLIPLAGLVIFLVWNNEKPKSAKSAGLGALIRVILSIILVIVIFIFVFIAEPDYRERWNPNSPYEYSERYNESNWT